MKQFETFCYSFYVQLVKGLDALNFDDVKAYYKFGFDDQSSVTQMISAKETTISMNMNVDGKFLADAETDVKSSLSDNSSNISSKLTKNVMKELKKQNEQLSPEVASLAVELAPLVNEKVDDKSKIFNCNGLLFYLIEVSRKNFEGLSTDGNFDFRYAITASNLYYKATEIYFSLYDLHRVN